jgi:hypothetical protein
VIRTIGIATAGAALVVVTAGRLDPAAVAAQAATMAPSSVQAAQDATKAARQVTFDIARIGGTVHGMVQMYTIGHTRTRIAISIPKGGNYRFKLYPGTECSDNRAMAASAIALTQMNTAAGNAPQSQTIVQLPIEKVSRNYVVDVRDANTKSSVIAGCAHLTP